MMALNWLKDIFKDQINLEDFKEPTPEHAPLKTQEMKDRIIAGVSHCLSQYGFEKPKKQHEVWVNSRTDNINDLINVIFYGNNAPKALRVGLRVGIHCPQADRLISKVCNRRYNSISAAISCLLINIQPREKTEWYFWNTAFSEKELDNLLGRIKNICLPFLQNINDYPALIKYIEQRKMFPNEEILAALYLLTGDQTKAITYMEKVLFDNTSLSEKRRDCITTLLKMTDSGEIKAMLNN